MAGTNAAPQLYVVQSKIGNSDWVLTIKNGAANISDWTHQDSGLHIDHNSYSDAQLWMKEDDPRGGFFLRAPTIESSTYPTGICLRAGGSQGDGGPTLVPKTMADPEMIWRKEGGDDWGCLNKLPDWEQKLQLSGDGPYDGNSQLCNYEYDGGSDHELWKLVPYVPQYSAANIIYAEGQLSKGDPITATSQVFVNRSATATADFTATLSTSQTQSHTHSVSNTSSNTLTLTQAIGAKFSIEKVLEVNETSTASRALSTSTAIGDQDTISDTVTATTSVKVTVPPSKSYEVALLANRCTLVAPYTATLTRMKPDGSAGATYTIKGQYTYSGAYRYEVAIYDVDASGNRIANVTQQAATQVIAPMTVA
jgi:hypothetical protein